MHRAQFEKIIAEEFPKAVPEKFRDKIKNVGILVEDEPSAELLKERGLLDKETLLGLYSGVPLTVRGDSYGIGMALPDTITLYQKPIEEMAGSDDPGAVASKGLTRPKIRCDCKKLGIWKCMKHSSGRHDSAESKIRIVIRETLWHEVGHYFGLSDEEIEKREHLNS